MTVLPALPLTPFEQYMLADDRAGYPMNFFIRLDLEGRPDREAMDGAFAEALLRHPLLNATLSRRGTRLHWAIRDQPLSKLRWESGQKKLQDLAGDPLDLRRQGGVRGMVHIVARRACLVITFHHAVCDGIGGFRFVGDLLACYGRRVAGSWEKPVLLPLRPQALISRGTIDLRLPERLPYRALLKGTLRECWKVVSRRPMVLASKSPRARKGSGPNRNVEVELLDRDTYRSVCARAEQQGVTPNDLLLRDMFLVVKRWNECCGGGTAEGWIRIAMPTSLRDSRDACLPAGNKLGYAFVTHHTAECETPQRLLADVAADTRAIRSWGLGAIFVNALRHSGQVPGLIWLGARLSRRFSTLVLSNLGDPARLFRARFPRRNGRIRAGNLTVRRMSGVPPVRPGTRAAWGLFSYPEGLTIALNADPRWFSREDAQELLGMYRAQLERSARGPDHAMDE